MNIDETKFEQLVEREIKSQINKKLDKAIERIITREVCKIISDYRCIDGIAKEVIKGNKDLVLSVAKATSDELYANLVRQTEDSYYDDEC